MRIKTIATALLALHVLGGAAEAAVVIVGRAPVVIGAGSHGARSRHWTEQYCVPAGEPDGAGLQTFVCKYQTAEGARRAAEDAPRPKNRCKWSKVVRQIDGAKYYGCWDGKGFWGLPEGGKR